MRTLTTLLDDRYAPLTYSIGFLQATAKQVAKGMTAFFRRVHFGGKATQLQGSLTENLLHLQPLTTTVRPRTLLTGTKLEGWTALFDGHATGQGIGQLTAYMARTMKTRGYLIAVIPPASNGSPLGARQFHVLGPESELGQVRCIDLVENYPGKWEFHLHGPTQPYEDLDTYTRRRKVDRFTEQTLITYTEAVGLHPWDENFYTAPYYLITNGEQPHHTYSLTEARTKLGLPN